MFTQLSITVDFLGLKTALVYNVVSCIRFSGEFLSTVIYEILYIFFQQFIE